MNHLRFFVSILLLGIGLQAAAQHLPGDSAVKKGRLENGLTYYICHNELPAQRAEFYLATNVGAIQETPDQDGLAHFLEHMCFNGTKNFPGKGIINYLQSIGASFGGNVNASTGVEETIYMLNNIPLADPAVVDSCLLILHDYSHFVTCDPLEIDKERGVILEEKRSRNDANWRLHEQTLPILYGDTKYANCTIIGSEDNLKSFKPESLTSFYKTWYRPDLQAVIVVGDVDVDDVEAKIAALWSDIPAAVEPQVKANIQIPANTAPAIGVLLDPEMANTNIYLYWKSQIDGEEGNDTPPYVVENLLKDIVSLGMQERLSDIAAKPDAPFTLARFSTMNLCETLDATVMILIPKEGQSEQCIATAYTEAERLRRFGLSGNEIARAKAEVSSGHESAAAKASSRKNAEFVMPLVNNFFDNHEYMSPADKFGLVKGILPQLPASMINDMATKMITEENLAVLYYGPDKEGMAHPAEGRISEIIREVKASDIRQNAEQEVTGSFVDADALSGSVIKKIAPTVQGATEWTLANGAKVILFPTQCEKDKILIRLIKKGGRSRIATDDLPSFEDNLWSIYQMNRGVSDFSAADVKKMLSGKNVSAQSFISPSTHGIAVSSTAKDIETAFQLAYLQFCKPRFDAAEYNQSIQMIEPLICNLERMPQYKFQKQAYKTLYDNPRRPLLSREVLDAASLQTIEKVYKSLFNDAAGLVTIIVGDFDSEAVKPLVEKYIGSIPKGRKAPKWVDAKDGIRPGTRENDFSVPMATPKVTVSQVYSIKKHYSAKWDVSLDALKYILRMIYTDTLREDEGGTYSAQVAVIAGQRPSDQSLLEVDFETNPEAADKLRAMARDAIVTLAAEGPTADQFDKAVKNLQKKVPEDRVKDSYWLTGLEQWYIQGIDYISEYESAIGALTAEDVKNAARMLLDSGNFVELIMRPEQEANNN